LTAHSPIVLLVDIRPETLAQLREYLASVPHFRQAIAPAEPQLPLAPALPAGTVTPALLDIVALRASHFAHGHTVEADLMRDAGHLAKAGRTNLVDAIDELNRGPGRRPQARKSLARAAALILAELDRLDAQDSRENLPTRNGEPA